jgi:hypothetical protein
MRRVNLDSAPPDVQSFLKQLPLDTDGVELESAGRVVMRVLPPGRVTDKERQAVIARGRELARAARARNEGVPAEVIDREIQQAIDEVRQRQR